jgi:nucleoid-associated protein YgaU
MTLFAGEKAKEQKSVMETIRARLQEFGWRVLYYESEDKELWGNQGIGVRGYIVGAPPGMGEMKETKVITTPKMLKEEELKTLKDELSQAMNTVELKKEQRMELEYYLAQVESQIAAYKEQFEVLGGVTYTVEKNDSLWKIAKKQYGDPYKWPVIYRANEDKIRNPNLIHPGQELQIPKIKVRR